jgi:peroxiredoxin
LLTSTRRTGTRSSRSALRWLILPVILSATILAGCHTMVPLVPDESGFAPTLAPPITPQQPGVGTSVGYLAPDFKLNNLSGRELKLTDFRGELVLLNFWTYCDICKEELPYIQRAFEDRESIAPGLVILAINVGQPEDQVEQFVNYYGYTFEFLMDSWATAATDYYIHEIPTTFFIDRNGIIQDIQEGKFSRPEDITGKLARLASR